MPAGYFAGMLTDLLDFPVLQSTSRSTGPARGFSAIQETSETACGYAGIRRTQQRGSFLATSATGGDVSVAMTGSARAGGAQRKRRAGGSTTSFAAYNADKFIPLTRFRQQHRRTEYGRGKKLSHTVSACWERKIKNETGKAFFPFDTEDGRLCAAAFIQDQQPFTNCTDIAAPTPSAENVVGREWCYVEAQLLNKPVNGEPAPNWGYCQPVPDYDELRHDLDNDNLSGVDLPEGVELSDAEIDKAAEKAAEAAAM
ncbi:unnamed protein product [Amoebophrya sp. A120]|nr:unnamed protein product [Amoebophrya sp. A120]|eukprot:GSA120T00025689001.1